MSVNELANDEADCARRRKAIADRLLAEVAEWDRDAVVVALTEALVERAWDICHETGDPDTFDAFVYRTCSEYVSFVGNNVVLAGDQ